MDSVESILSIELVESIEFRESHYNHKYSVVGVTIFCCENHKYSIVIITKILL